MHKTILAIILTSFLLAGKLHAQWQIRILDEEDNNLISGAVIQVRSLENKAEKVTLISTENGNNIVKNVSLPAIIQVRHLAYTTLIDTINTTSYTLLLKKQTHSLEQVVVTGQFEPQSAKNSVYQVKTILSERIEAQGAVNLQTVLQNELNIRFSRDNATGSARYSMQGLSGQGVKILIDGIPMVGRSGTANEIDLNQIDVNNIDRIELVEGPMAVNYGADALAGVVNIITKKGSRSKWEVGINLHEETVGNEYDFFEDGIHNPSVNLVYRISPDVYARANTRLNRFGGWTGNGTGRNKSWYPKTQLFGSIAAGIEKEKFNLHYRLDYLDETLENNGSLNDTNPLKDPFAIDEHYLSNRWMHQLQSDITLGKTRLNGAISFTDYSRTTRQFTKNLITGDERTTVLSEQDTITYHAFFIRQTLNNLLSTQWNKYSINNQIGFEADMQTADGSTLNEGSKQVNNYALFASSEVTISEKLKIRGGVRFTYNNIFRAVPTPSLNLKYDLNEQTSLRMAYARGYRAPSARELYHEFIDANHNIVGNEDLNPEYSHNINASLSHKLHNLPLSIEASGFYNHINNQITFFTPEEVNLPTTYTNLLLYKTTGGRVTGNLKFNRWQLSGGFALIGEYQRISEEAEGQVPTFLYAPEFNSVLQYKTGEKGIQLSAFYKFTGAARRYQLVTDEEGNGRPELRKINAFQFLDITASKKLGQLMTLALGARNVLNVTQVNNNIGGGAHSGNANGQSPIAYGRSYFLKINFNLKSIN